VEYAVGFHAEEKDDQGAYELPVGEANFCHRQRRQGAEKG